MGLKTYPIIFKTYPTYITWENVRIVGWERRRINLGTVI